MWKEEIYKQRFPTAWFPASGFLRLTSDLTFGEGRNSLMTSQLCHVQRPLLKDRIASPRIGNPMAAHACHTIEVGHFQTSRLLLCALRTSNYFPLA